MMWSDQWWQDGRPPQALPLTNGSRDHHRALSNGTSDWEIITSSTSTADGSLLSVSSSSPETRKNHEPSPPLSSTAAVKPAGKLSKKSRTSMSNVKRLVSSKSSPTVDIGCDAVKGDASQRLPSPSDSALNSSSSTPGVETKVPGAKSHTRHSSISTGTWHRSSNDRLSQPQARYDSMHGVDAIETPHSSSSSSSRSGDLSPSPAPLFPDLSSNKQVNSGSTSEQSSWSDSSDAASWDSDLKTPPLYDVCDIASSLSNEKTNSRLTTMHSQLSTPSLTSSPEKNNISQGLPAYMETNTGSSAQDESSPQTFWSDEPAVLELDTDSPYFHAPTNTTLSPKKTIRKLDTSSDGKVPKSFSSRGPIPIANGHAGKQKAYSLVAEEGVQTRSLVLYEYEKPKPILQDSDLVHPYFPYVSPDHLGTPSSPVEHLFRRPPRVDQYDNDEEDEDRANAITIAVLLIMGVAFIVGVVFLIYSSSNVKAEYDAGDKDSVDLMNAVYQRRIADIITDASRQHELHVKTYHTGNMAPNTGLAQGKGQGQGETKASAETQILAGLVQGKQLCPIVPEELIGNGTDVNLTMPLDIDDIMAEHADVLEGGEWMPKDCVSRHRVAFVIPYRDRWGHLKSLLYYLIPLLKRQQIHFRMFVVEQFGNDTFNKGRIMNAAFREALKLFDFQCVTFHDVDLVPEDDRNMYSCAEMPKHMSIGIDKFNYRLPYEGLVGGVLMFRTEHFQQVNGYSNMYWGWGAEDDDMTTRILHQGLRIYRPPSNIARYKMVKHDGRKVSEVSVRMKLLRSAARRSKMEGLNNINYNLLYTHTEKLFTHFLVDIGHP